MTFTHLEHKNKLLAFLLDSFLLNTFLKTFEFHKLFLSILGSMIS